VGLADDLSEGARTHPHGEGLGGRAKPIRTPHRRLGHVEQACFHLRERNTPPPQPRRTTPPHDLTVTPPTHLVVIKQFLTNLVVIKQFLTRSPGWHDDQVDVVSLDRPWIDRKST